MEKISVCIFNSREQLTLPEGYVADKNANLVLITEGETINTLPCDIDSVLVLAKNKIRPLTEAIEEHGVGMNLPLRTDYKVAINYTSRYNARYDMPIFKEGTNILVDMQYQVDPEMAARYNCYTISPNNLLIKYVTESPFERVNYIKNIVVGFEDGFDILEQFKDDPVIVDADLMSNAKYFNNASDIKCFVRELGKNVNIFLPNNLDLYLELYKLNLGKVKYFSVDTNDKIIKRI